MESLDARVRVVWFAGSVVTAAILGGLVAVAALVLEWRPLLGVAVFLALAVLGGVFAVLRYRSWRFELQEDALYIERGVLVRVRTVVPYVRVQHVDSRRSPLERLLGLASVVVYTAGSRGADVDVPGLLPGRAENLQEELRALAIESEFEDAV